VFCGAFRFLIQIQQVTFASNRTYFSLFRSIPAQSFHPTAKSQSWCDLWGRSNTWDARANHHSSLKKEQLTLELPWAAPRAEQARGEQKRRGSFLS